MKKTIAQSVFYLLFIPFSLIWCYPFLWMISSSFKSQSEMLLGGLSMIPRSATFDNYKRAWEAAKFEHYFANTVIVTVSAVLIVIIVCSMAGYALGRSNIPGKKWIIGALVASMFLPKGFTIIPVFKVIVALGLNNTLMGVILAEVGPAKIVPILLFMSYYAAIPREVEESARMDGASFPLMFFRIMLPLSKPVIGTVTIMNFITFWNAFFVPLIFTLGKPSLRTLGVGMYAFRGEFTIDWTGLAAGACISIIPVIMVFLFLQRYFIEGISGAVKG
ncbi:carbohydrate ABC transporter permease [Paenibacillus sp. HB172176]|uniref:carbohydrate ABC transporter permease n=1 Tax=Paenibacillus sp. HB172176 TaxID=2493690 RepID=UPI00143912CE|nr:carbohydrate ABC transporter permease [Paenibacillus sp. HB172176]